MAHKLTIFDHLKLTAESAKKFTSKLCVEIINSTTSTFREISERLNDVEKRILPSGGSSGQALIKISDTDYETEWGGYVYNDNILDNSRWDNKENIINQRGENIYSGAWKCYGIDRWYGSGPKLTITVEDGYIYYDQTGNNEYMQEIDGAHSLAGQTVTFSVLAEIESGVLGIKIRGNGTLDNYSTSSKTGLQIISCTYKLPDEITDTSNYKYPLVSIYGQAKAKLYAAKLELGSTQTLAHKEGDTWVLNNPPPNKALELAKCQRYQIPISGCFNGVTNTNDIILYIPLPSTLHKVPANFTATCGAYTDTNYKTNITIKTTGITNRNAGILITATLSDTSLMASGHNITIFINSPTLIDSNL